MISSLLKLTTNGMTDFDIVIFPFLGVDILQAAPYGVYISQMIRSAWESGQVNDFNNRNFKNGQLSVCLPVKRTKSTQEKF